MAGAFRYDPMVVSEEQRISYVLPFEFVKPWPSIDGHRAFVGVTKAEDVLDAAEDGDAL